MMYIYRNSTTNNSTVVQVIVVQTMVVRTHVKGLDRRRRIVTVDALGRLVVVHAHIRIRIRIPVADTGGFQKGQVVRPLRIR
jgi:hypothetical protein